MVRGIMGADGLLVVDDITGDTGWPLGIPSTLHSQENSGTSP